MKNEWEMLLRSTVHVDLGITCTCRSRIPSEEFLFFSRENARQIYIYYPMLIARQYRLCAHHVGVAGAALRKVERCARREGARVGGDDACDGFVGICLVVLVEAHSDEEIPIGAVGARRAAEVGQYVLDEAVRRHHVDVRHGEGYTDTRMLTAPVLIMEKSLRSFDDVTSS